MIFYFFSLAWNFLIGPLVEFELIQGGPPFCQKNWHVHPVLSLLGEYPAIREIDWRRRNLEKKSKRRLRKIDRHRGHVSTKQEAMVGVGQHGQVRQLPVELACPNALHIEKNNSTRCVLCFSLSLFNAIRFLKYKKKNTYFLCFSVLHLFSIFL